MSKASIQALLDRVMSDTIEAQKANKQRATGKSAASLEKNSTDTSGELLGNKYFYQQIYGRRPGKFPGESLDQSIDNILTWIKAKNIQPRDPKTTLKQLAFLFARKLSREGSDVFLNRRPALDFEGIVEKNLVIFEKELAAEYKAQIFDKVLKALNVNLR